MKNIILGILILAGLAYLTTLVKNMDAEVNNHKRICSPDNVRPCHEVGTRYYHGDGVDKNITKAEEYFTMACDGNNIFSCMYLADINHERKDYTRAVEFTKKVCESDHDGHVEGCNRLGISYGTGEGVKQDYTKASKYYQKACDGDSYFACGNLGVLYIQGQGVEKDLHKAVELFIKGCNDGKEYGSDSACYNLALAYGRGTGIRQSDSSAKEHFGKACDLGLNEGCEAYAKMNKK